MTEQVDGLVPEMQERSRTQEDVSKRQKHAGSDLQSNSPKVTQGATMQPMGLNDRTPTTATVRSDELYLQMTPPRRAWLGLAAFQKPSEPR